MAQAPNGDTDANECSFAGVNRKSRRGGNWVTTVADFPSPSLYVRAPHDPAWRLRSPTSAMYLLVDNVSTNHVCELSTKQVLHPQIRCTIQLRLHAWLKRCRLHQNAAKLAPLLPARCEM